MLVFVVFDVPKAGLGAFVPKMLLVLLGWLVLFDNFSQHIGLRTFKSSCSHYHLPKRTEPS